MNASFERFEQFELNRFDWVALLRAGKPVIVWSSKLHARLCKY